MFPYPFKISLSTIAKIPIIMKHTLLSILLILVFSQVYGQTALYKHYRNRPGIQASDIRNYDIGNGTKVTVTMLEASDSSSFNALKRKLKAMKPSGTKPDPNIHVDVPPFLGDIKSMDMQITPTGDANGTPHHVDIQSAAPLRGDSGEYLICGSDKTMSILVFHCPDSETYRKVVKFVLLSSFK